MLTLFLGRTTATSCHGVRQSWSGSKAISGNQNVQRSRLNRPDKHLRASPAHGAGLAGDDDASVDVGAAPQVVNLNQCVESDSESTYA
jgi:hypothetical protein